MKRTRRVRHVGIVDENDEPPSQDSSSSSSTSSSALVDELTKKLAQTSLSARQPTGPPKQRSPPPKQQSPSPPTKPKPVDYILHLHKHRPLYRVIHAQTPRFNNAGVLHPRRNLSTDTACPACLRRYTALHLDQHNEKGTPFTSLTSDLLRAFSLASKCQEDRAKWPVEILVIDPSYLRGGSCCNLTALHRVLYGRTTGDDKYVTEYLVWGTIPPTAVATTWKWERIIESELFTRSRATPSIFTGHIPVNLGRPRTVQELRGVVRDVPKTRSEGKKSQSQSDFINSLDFEVRLEWNFAWQRFILPIWHVMATLNAWWEGYCGPALDRHFRDLEQLGEFRKVKTVCLKAMENPDSAEESPDFWSWAGDEGKLRYRDGFWRANLNGGNCELCPKTAKVYRKTSELGGHALK